MDSKYFVLGGDIKKSLSEGYQFDLKKLFSDSFLLTRKNFFPLFTAYLLFTVILSALLALFINGEKLLLAPTNGLLLIAILLFLYPTLMTGLLMMGINHSIGLKSQSFHLFSYFKILLVLSLSSFLMISVIVGVGLVFTSIFSSVSAISVLLVLIILYLKMSFIFVYPLIAEKKVSPMLALKLSFKLVNKNLSQFTLLLIIFCLLFIVTLFTSGIGMLFVAPFYVNMMGIIYRQVCGVTISVTETNDNTDDNNNDSHHGGFEA